MISSYSLLIYCSHLYEQLHFPKSGQVDLRQRLHRQAGERDSGRQEDHGQRRCRSDQDRRPEARGDQGQEGHRRFQDPRRPGHRLHGDPAWRADV